MHVNPAAATSSTIRSTYAAKTHIVGTTYTFLLEAYDSLSNRAIIKPSYKTSFRQYFAAGALLLRILCMAHNLLAHTLLARTVHDGAYFALMVHTLLAHAVHDAYCAWRILCLRILCMAYTLLAHAVHGAWRIVCCRHALMATLRFELSQCSQ